MRLPAFLSNIRGNATVTFGLMVFGLAVAVGGAVDFGNVISHRSKAQDALDASTLAVAILRPTTVDQAKIEVAAKFKQNLGGDLDGLAIDEFKYDVGTRTYYVTAKGSYDTFILRLINMNQIPYTVASKTVQAANGTLELSLVLDNTWSMSDPLDGSKTRLDVLKTAATNLVNTIMTDSNKDYVKVAVVPYADYVNVGTGNRGQSWLSVAADYSTTSTKTCTKSTTRTECTGGTKGTCTRVKDGVTESYTCWIVAQTCVVKTVPEYETCSGGGTTNYKWYGCVRNQMASSVLVLPDPLSVYTGIVQTSQTCPSPIQPLTNDRKTVTTAISQLVYNVGSYQPETFIPAGMTWGVNTLSPPSPFTEGKAYDAKNKEPKKVIVLMTDGANTLYSDTAGNIAKINGNATRQTATYTNQANVCNYAKAKKIEIYVIGLGVTDSTALSALKSCATDEDNYFDAKDANDLIQAFEIIGGKLSVVRLME